MYRRIIIKREKENEQKNIQYSIKKERSSKEKFVRKIKKFPISISEDVLKKFFNSSK